MNTFLKTILVFLWLKAKETWGAWPFLAVWVAGKYLVVHLDPGYFQNQPSILSWLWGLLIASLCVFVIFLIACVKELTIPWLRDNWRKAKEIVGDK